MKEALKVSLRESNYVTVTCQPGAVSMASHRTTDGAISRTNAGTPQWQAFSIFYLDGNTVRRNRIDVVSFAEIHPIETHDFGCSPMPLSSYLNGGQTLANNIAEFEWVKMGQDRIQFRIVSEVRSRDNLPAARMELVSSVVTRN